MSAKLEALQRQLDALPPWQQLYIASELLKQPDKADLAITIADNVVMEYRAAKLLGRAER